MNEPVGIQQDDDVTVLNRPAAEALYQPRHTSHHDVVDDEIWSKHVPAQIEKDIESFLEVLEPIIWKRDITMIKALISQQPITSWHHEKSPQEENSKL